MRFPRWLIPIAIIVGLVLLVAAPLIGAYNDLVNREERVNQSFSDLDSQYQRRADLIPNLASAVRATLKQERAIFEQITDARARYAGANTPEERVQAQNGLESALGRLLVIIEDNQVRLGSNERVADLMVQLEGTENRVNQARRVYNAEVTSYNVNIRRFPRSVIANLFGFERKQVFEVENVEDRSAPDVGEDLDIDEDEETPAPTG